VLGPIGKGDLILIGKRPEVGGTSFMISQFVHMVTQLPKGKNAIIFNNEEEPSKLYTRLIQAVTNVSVSDIIMAPTKYQQKYLDAMGDKKIDIHRDTFTTKEVEQALSTEKYGLIAINTLLKIGNQYKAEDHDRLEVLGRWCRKLSSEYGPVMVIHQADLTAEGIKRLNQSQLYKSKTALQGECDIQLMIGASHDVLEYNLRWINVVKRKQIIGGNLSGNSAPGNNIGNPFIEVTFIPEKCLWM
jgi:hypothetical protein